MQSLWLHENSLSGTIPSELGDLSNLQILWLFSNSLSGTLPSELGSLSNLGYLDLYNNSLSGTIPSELGDLSNLQILYLNSNSLSGTIPSWLGSLSKLLTLWLHENSLSGTISSELGSLSDLQNLSLYENSLSGTLPSELGETNSGENFNLDVSTYFGDINNNITSYGANGLPNGLTIDSSSGAIGGTPTTEGNFAVTVRVEDTEGNDVSDEFNIYVRPNRNGISDELDIDVGLTLDADDYAALQALYTSTSGENWTNNTGWDVSSETPPIADDVELWHGVTVEGSRVTEIDLHGNGLSGTLPSELGDLSNLQNLSLHDNSLSGTLPESINDINDNITNYSASGLPNGLTVDSINFDIDGNGETDALTDGVVVMRYLFQFSGDVLINGVIGVGATRTTALEITNYLDMARETMLDVDGNGMADALTDGIMIMRYLFGFEGNTVIDEALGPDTTRTTAAAIIDHLQSFDIGF